MEAGALKWIIIATVTASNIVAWAAAAHARARKARKKDAQGSNSKAAAHTTLDEAGLIRILQEIAKKRIDMQPERVEHPEHDAWEPQPEETAAAMQQSIEAATRRSHTPQEPTDAAEQPENAEKRTENADNDAFDLRQAVIMSEILRPKFDE